MEIRFKILPELQRLIPPLSSEEYEQLEKNLLSDGVRDPLVIGVYPDENGEEQRVLIDGHNRYNIAVKHGLIYDTTEKQFESYTDVVVWMVLNQFGRRNLQPFQRIELSLVLEDNYRKLAKLNQLRTHENRVCQNSDKQEIDTKKELAKVANVSHDTLAKGKKIAEKADEETKQKLRSGEVSINKVYQDIKKQEKKEKKEDELREKAEQAKMITLDLDFYHGDFEEVLDYLDDGSLDCIITDPPYPYEFIECWTKLSRFAAKKLKPGGFCIAYSGQMHLPEVYKRMSEHLDYYWTFNLIHTGSRQLINGRNLFCGWKPLLVYQNGFSKRDSACDDFIIGTGLEKDAHRWQQSLGELDYVIKNFTDPGDLVCEPFAGGGTTIIAAIKNGRRIVAAEINEQSYNISKSRVSEWVK